MQIININKTDNSEIVSSAVKVLTRGGILIYPTETAYGAGVDATNQKAVDRVLEYKARMSGKPLSVAVSDEKMAKEYVQVNQTAQSIYQNFLPGPITVISHGLHRVAKGVESEQGTLGIRIPDYDLILQVMRKLGRPITATSANLSGEKTPYSVGDILNNISNHRRQMIDLILDAGQLRKRPTSTVVDTTMEDYQVIRDGAIKLPDRQDATACASNKEVRSQKSELRSSYISKSPEETQKIAKVFLLKHISVLKQKCLVFALEGDLGSGKTQFAKGLAEALNIKETITSPTFNLILEHPFSPTFPISPSSCHSPNSPYFFHLDTWRLLDPKELDDLSLEQMLKPGNVVAIEWAEKIADWQLATGNWQKIRVKFEHISKNQRRIQISALTSLSSLSS